MTVLALDVGNRRIGVAVSDSTDLLVRPLTVLTLSNSRAAGEAIGRLVEETHADTIVVGLPLHADGTPSPQSEMIEMGVPRNKRKALLDAAAAAVILDDWLLSNRRRGSGEGARG